MLLHRRSLLASLAALIAVPAAAAAPARKITVYKDPNCGCCGAWAKRMAATGRYTPALVDEPDMLALKTRLRVPPELGSCHTTTVAGLVVEGHVPPAAIDRLLRARPKGIIGLAVPGMPAGSPGMEMPDGRRDPYIVYAFAADGSSRPFMRIA